MDLLIFYMLEMYTIMCKEPLHEQQQQAANQSPQIHRTVGSAPEAHHICLGYILFDWVSQYLVICQVASAQGLLCSPGSIMQQFQVPMPSHSLAPLCVHSMIPICDVGAIVCSCSWFYEPLCLMYIVLHLDMQPLQQ